jgi:hypothetical protein
MYRFTHAAAALLCIISVSAFAESGEVQRTINAAPGVNVSAGVYADIKISLTALQDGFPRSGLLSHRGMVQLLFSAATSRSPI